MLQPWRKNDDCINFVNISTCHHLGKPRGLHSAASPVLFKSRPSLNFHSWCGSPVLVCSTSSLLLSATPTTNPL